MLNFATVLGSQTVIEMMNLADVHCKHEYPVAIIVILSSFFLSIFWGFFLPWQVSFQIENNRVLVLSSFTNTFSEVCWWA